jgi:hypothetical protein
MTLDHRRKRVVIGLMSDPDAPCFLIVDMVRDPEIGHCVMRVRALSS